MGERNMMQYLMNIKSKCDDVEASCAPLSAKDVILYDLNDLTSSSQSFKMTRTNLQPIPLDDFYALLCSEEVNLIAEALKEQNNRAANEQQFSLAVCGRGNGGRTRYA